MRHHDKFTRGYTFDYDTGQLIETGDNPFDCYGGGGKGGGCSQIGHSYFMTLAYAFCGTSEEVLGFKRSGTTEWSGSLTTSGTSFTAKTGLRPDPVPDDYDYSLETCPITYYNGSQLTANSILQTHTGSPVAYTGTTYIVVGDRSATVTPLITGKYGILSAVASAALSRGAYIGMNVTSVPQYKMKLRRTTVAAALGASRINDDVNPAHIIYDILTTHLELDAGAVDVSSFTAAATTLATEGIGLSIAMTVNKSAADWVDEMLRHIDGVLYYDINVGKYKLRLLRDDYTIGALPVVSESNSYGLVVERKSWAETYNTFTFKYTNRDAKAATSLVITDTANKKTVGQTKSKTVEYMAVTEASTMELIANRAVKKLSYPLASVKFKVSSIDFPTLQIGDVLNLTHTIYGIADMPIRVLTLGGDKEDSTIIEVEGTEDIYGITKATNIVDQASLATEVTWAVGPMVNAAVAELPGEFYTEGTILPMGAAPTGNVSYISCTEVNPSAAENSVGITPYQHGTIDALLSDTDVEYTLEDIAFTSSEILEESVLTEEDWQRGQHVAVIGSEFIIYKDLESNGGSSYTLTRAIRGAFGSVIASHAASDDIWLFGGDYRALNVTTTSQTIRFAGHNAKEEGATLDVAHTYTQLSETPYKPVDVTGSRNGSVVTIVWDPAVRRSGATYYDADTVTAGVNEGEFEGTWKVSWNTGEEIVTTPLFTITEAASKTYTITSVLNGIESAGEQVVI